MERAPSTTVGNRRTPEDAGRPWGVDDAISRSEKETDLSVPIVPVPTSASRG